MTPDGKRANYNIYLKKYLGDAEGPPASIPPRGLVGLSSRGTAELADLFEGDVVFSNPKSTDYLKYLFATGMEDCEDGLLLDFFAGSGTSGHTVMLRNSNVGGRWRYICVQIPEQIDHSENNQKVASAFLGKNGWKQSIAEITKERLRRAGAKLKTENPLFAGDLGFRVYKLDSSNLKAWDPQPNSLEAQLALGVDHIKPGRTESDLLTELLLKLGLELTVPVEPQSIAGHTVFVVGLGALLAVLSPRIRRDEAEPLALGLAALHESLRPASLTDEAPSPKARPARESTTVLFRDAAFEDDVAKANLVAILEQRGLTHLRSL